MSFSEASGIITQTGTDTDLSGLSGVSGVTVVDNGSHKTYHIDGKALIISGTLTIDPQVECLLFERQDLFINGTLNFGITSVIGGATRYSRAIGLISHDAGYVNFTVNSAGTLNWNGGAMKLMGGCDFKDGSNVSITNGIIIAINSVSQRLRMNTDNCSVDGLSIDGNCRFDVFKTFVKFDRYNPGFTTAGIIQKVGSTHGGTDDPLVLTDFDAQGIESPNGDFLGSSYRATKIEFVNMGFTGDFNISHDSTGGASAVSTLYKDIKLKIVDTDISDIEGAKYWTTDKNNGSRFSGTAVWRGSQNADETFSSDRVYTGSTDSNGEATERLLTRACYGGASPSGVYNGSTTIDYRGETTDNTDVFNFYVASYAHTLNNVSPSCLGTGVLEQQVVLFSDVFLTESDKTIVDGYTEINTPEKFYDRAKAHLVDNFAGETATIVSRNGNTINIGSYDLDVDAGENAPVFAFDGSKITIKASTFVGDITTTGGTITLLNNAKIVGNYGDVSVLPFTITNVEAGSTVQLYNVTDSNEISNAVVTGTAGTKVTYSGTYANSLADPNDEVRLRITCAASDGAFLPFETFGVASTAGISFKANQVDDTIYNDNAVDGSATNYDTASLTITPDYSNFELDISDDDDPGSVTVQQIYAKYAYLITTTDGIDKFFGAITAENPSNYRINTDVVDLKIQNISSSDIIITGARLYRDDSTTVIIKGPAGSGTLSHDTGKFLQFIQPQVTAALNGYGALGPDDLNAVKKNTNLIPGLL